MKALNDELIPYIKAVFDFFHYNLKTITNTRNTINICIDILSYKEMKIICEKVIFLILLK